MRIRHPVRPVHLHARCIAEFLQGIRNAQKHQFAPHTPLHRLLGKIWMVLMVITSLSSFFIHQIDLFYGFSPIHLLSILP